jgi:ABC-type glycerol-3-phosphate transport system permease component
VGSGAAVGAGLPLRDRGGGLPAGPGDLADYFYAFAFVSDESSQTLMAAVGSTSVDISDSGFGFAAVTIGVAPVSVVCAFFADVYARGLGAGVVD